VNDPPRERDIANHFCQDSHQIAEKLTGKRDAD